MTKPPLAEFGVIVTCSPRDLWMAKGCCASVRHFMPDAPICLLYDGPGSGAASLARTYAASVLCWENVGSDVLRQKSFGYGLTKMIAFWESPFERFLLIDADTVVLGDFRTVADFSSAEIMIDLPKQTCTPSEIAHWFFDPEKLSILDSQFDWSDRKYVCTGVIRATSELFDLSDYLSLLSIARNDPLLFKFGEMGLLNYLIFRGADRGEFRLQQAPIQLLANSYTYDALAQRIDIPRFGRDEIGMRDGSAVVLHYAGVRPYTFNQSVFPEPMTYFRRQHRMNCRKAIGTRDLPLRFEEYLLRHPRAKRLLRPLVGNRG